MPGESANSELIIPSEDAPTEGFDIEKYLVRDQVLTFEVKKQTKKIAVKIVLRKGSTTLTTRCPEIRRCLFNL